MTSTNGPADPRVNGTRISSVLDADVIGYIEDVIGYIEIDTTLESGARLSRIDGWADVGNLHVDEAHRHKGIGTWLVSQAAVWLELGEITRKLDYADADDATAAAFLDRIGLRLLTRTIRGLTLQ